MLERIEACVEPLRHELAFMAVTVIVVPVSSLSSSDFPTLRCVPDLFKNILKVLTHFILRNRPEQLLLPPVFFLWKMSNPESIGNSLRSCN